MLSELLVESFYAYIPESHGSTHPKARASQRLTYAIKDGRKFERPGRGWVPAYDLAAEVVAGNLLADSVLRSASSFIAIPGSAQPPPVPGPHHSVSREIAKALVAAGIGRQVEDVLVRTRSVTKASLGGRRSALQHRETLGIVDRAQPPEEPVVLLNDVATTGAQMMGASSRLLEAFPGLTQVQGFALIRTVGELNFVEIRDPVRRRTRLDPDGTGSCEFTRA